ncbi:MAG: FprA family A-type flavoprotein [Clostridiales bacterium]|nr:FprA family A-type flavoprotein [Clostridiales bacterium]
MHCVRKITDDVVWVGANDRRLAMFEGVYSVPRGVSYNSYLLTDEKTVLFDTVDKAVTARFFENLAFALNGKKLDYLVITHMEPDHSASVTELLLRYPDVKIICGAKTAVMLGQFFEREFDLIKVNEGDTFDCGSHTLKFIMAPMVHWPEVTMVYDEKDKLLFSADAFGTFGAMNGALFADEVDFDRDYLDEARRYYTNIVGKYGAQVISVLNKVAPLDISAICPLHGFVWRKDLEYYIDKYKKWSAYVPEEKGVLIAYASVYGNTENAAEAVASRLVERGIKTVMYDVSVTPASEIIAAAFRYSAFLFASTTYNMGIFVTMEDFLRDLAAHAIKNRAVAFIENGTWAPASGKLMRGIMETCKDIRFIENTVTLKSSLKASQEAELDALAAALAENI